MNVSQTRVRRESFGRIAETCPKADKAWKELQQSIAWAMEDDSEIKAVIRLVEQYHDLNTALRTDLREQLTTACEELLEALDRNDELISEMTDLRDDLRVANESIQQLEEQIEEIKAQLEAVPQ